LIVPIEELGDLRAEELGVDGHSKAVKATRGPAQTGDGDPQDHSVLSTRAKILRERKARDLECRENG
jgi:hypothetical protein